MPEVENFPIYSIQQTYILKAVSKSGKRILTCDERIDIPTIEPLLSVKFSSYDRQPITIIPCIELAGEFLLEFDLTFETNEGVTVLPVNIFPQESLYGNSKYGLVLPRGATGVKSCNIIDRHTGQEVQHNFTFGIMSPPYRYDNALLAYLKLTTKTPVFKPINLPKGAGKQTINIEEGVLFYETVFIYPSSSNTTTHNPKITLRGLKSEQNYTLSLEGIQIMVTIDLLTGMITAYKGDTGEILKQLKVYIPTGGFRELSFDNFDDISIPYLPVEVRGARVI